MGIGYFRVKIVASAKFLLLYVERNNWKRIRGEYGISERNAWIFTELFHFLRRSIIENVFEERYRWNGNRGFYGKLVFFAEISMEINRLSNV